MHAREMGVREASLAIVRLALYTWVVAHFQTTVFPQRAAEVGRLPPIAVKLNGVTARTNPSSGRYSTRLCMPGPLIGCCR